MSVHQIAHILEQLIYTRHDLIVRQFLTKFNELVPKDGKVSQIRSLRQLDF
jgi:hypothetical protein